MCTFNVCVYIGLAKKCVRVFPEAVMKKPDRTFWPTLHTYIMSASACSYAIRVWALKELTGNLRFFLSLNFLSWHISTSLRRETSIMNFCESMDHFNKLVSSMFLENLF